MDQDHGSMDLGDNTDRGRGSRPAVSGSIAHVLHTAFRGLFQEESDRQQARRLTEEYAQQLAARHQREAAHPQGAGSAPGKKGKKSSMVLPSSEEAVKPPEIYVSEFEKLQLSETHRALYEAELQKIRLESQTWAEGLATATQEITREREIAAELLRQEEEDLKQHGVIVGQHVPAISHKHGLSESLTSLSSSRVNLLAAKDVLRGIDAPRETLESDLKSRSRGLEEERQDRPKYLLPTRTMRIREEVQRRRFPVPEPPNDRKAQKQSLGKEDRKVIGPSMAETLEHQEVMRSMQAKLSFRPNPRYDSASLTRSLVQAPTIPAKQPSHRKPVRPSKAVDEAYPTVFIAEPPVVEFLGFELGKEYSKRLCLKNVSTVRRTLRCIPPGSLAFSTTALEFPSGAEDGLLAPGMSASLTVHFRPSSLSDHRDCILIEAEGGSFEVQIVASRIAPQLTIASDIDVGKCLIGDAMRLEIPVFNSGGPARFILGDNAVLSISAIDDSSFDSLKTGSVRTPPFTLYPRAFELQSNQTISLMVEFVPTRLGQFSQSFFVLFDSLDSREIVVRGECRLIEVSLAEINGVSLAGDRKNNTNLYFAPTVVGEQSSLQIGVGNACGIAAEYEWVLLPSDLEGDRVSAECNNVLWRSKETYRTAVFGSQISRNSSTDSAAVAREFAIDMGIVGSSPPTASDDSSRVHCFAVSSRRGVLPETGAVSFDFRFAPDAAVINQSVLAVLMLKGVPSQALPENTFRRAQLQEEGHPRFYKLCSWIESEGARLNMQNDRSESLIQLSKLHSMVSTYVEAGDEVQEFVYRVSRYVKYFQLWAAYMIEDDDGTTITEGSSEISLFIWDGKEDSEYSEIVISSTKLEAYTASEYSTSPLILEEGRSILESLWISSKHAMQLLGEKLSTTLERFIVHEAVGYLQELNQTNVCILQLTLHGEGKRGRLPLKQCQEGKVCLPIGGRWSGCFELRNTTSNVIEVDIDLNRLSVWSINDLRRLDSSVVNLISSSSRVIIMPDTTAEIDFNLQMKELGTIELRIPITSNSEYISIDDAIIVIESTCPRLKFEQSEVDFSLHSVGTSGSVVLSLLNESSVPIK